MKFVMKGTKYGFFFRNNRQSGIDTISLCRHFYPIYTQFAYKLSSEYATDAEQCCHLLSDNEVVSGGIKLEHISTDF
jgi:hypothetical protein